MYGLNYNGATQVWAMMKNAERDENGNFVFDEEKYIKQINDMKTDQKYQSDSEKLQTALNKVADNLANIGQIKFNETEMNIIREQADHVAAIRGAVAGKEDRNKTIATLEAALLPETGPGGIALNKTVSSLVADKYLGENDPHVNNNLLHLSEAESQSKDYNNQILGRRFNREILPQLASLGESSISEEIVDLVYELQKSHSDALLWGSELRGKVGSNEFEGLNHKIDALIEALNRNTLSTSDSDINIHVTESF